MQLKKHIPISLKSFAKSLLPITLIDQMEVWAGERDSLTPPQRLYSVGGGDFKGHGKAFAQRLREVGNLQPTDRVLDIGSGLGRIAVGLLDYMTPPGSFDGLEIVKEGVDWSRRNITRHNPNFRFQHLDLYNKMYNPSGEMQSSKVVFPFKNEFFDFVFLTSVFTHMLEQDVERYFAEIARVLKPTGCVYATMFVLNPESRNLLTSGKSSIPFEPFTHVSMVQDRDVPEYAIAFDEEWVKGALQRAGLQLKDPIRYGYWVDRPDFYDYQDTLLLEKQGNHKPETTT